MRYTNFCGERVSLLGYGAMRFPTVDTEGGKEVDIARTEELIDRAIEAGVNYFDTAYPYHSGKSEIILGKLLSKYPRDNYFIADKFPGHQLMEDYTPSRIFEEQLRKCGVDYFDFYLLHNVYENSVDLYTDEKWGIIDYLLEQKRIGRIRHLGFSTHATVEGLEDFLRRMGEKMEFCQIQLNYLDYTLQRADEKCRLLEKYGIPIVVMEPVRGGRLASLDEEKESKLKARRPEESIASWAFRWIHRIPDVKVVLSGMSDMDQLNDNIRTFSEGEPLSDEEFNLLLGIAEDMKKSVPCTGCGYCTAECPKGLNIPFLLEVYNELSVSKSVNTSMRVEFLPKNEQPDACIRCGKCVRICPQRIDIPQTLSHLDDMVESMPSWRQICRQREEAAKAAAKDIK